MKFTIRELLLLTVIVAMGLGWWVDHRRQAKEIDKLNSVNDWGARHSWLNPAKNSPSK